MFVESGDFKDPDTLKGFDLCIVGAGAAGLALAHRLIGSPLKVLVLANGLPTDRGQRGFSTSGYANPTLTIVALALRLADHLSGRPMTSVPGTLHYRSHALPD